MADLSFDSSRIVDIVLLPVTLCYLAGATLAWFYPLAVQPLVHGRILILIAGAFFVVPLLVTVVTKHAGRRKKKKKAPLSTEKQPAGTRQLILLLLFFTLVGYIHTGLALQPPANPAHIYNLITKKTALTLQGRVTGLVTRSNDKSRFILELSHILFRNKPGAAAMVPAIGKVRLSMRGNLPDFVISGATILAVASVDRIHNYLTPGSFNYVLYMRNRGIYCSGWIKSGHHILLSPTSHHRPFSSNIMLPIQLVRQHIDTFLRQHCDPKVSGLYQALLIGDRSGLSQATLDHFALTGCMHLLAISGLHMGLLAFLLYGGIFWLLKRSQWLLLHTHAATMALCLTFPFLFTYAFIAGMNAPVFRAIIMAAFILLASLLYRQHDLLHLLAAAAIILTALQPLALFTVSFQLSFAALLAIALIAPSLHSFYQSEKTKKKYRPILRLPLTALFISLAATAGTLPLLLYHFNRFSPIGPLMNLLVEPLLCFIALPLGLMAAPLLAVSPKLAALLFAVGGQALHGADFLTSRAACLPGASIWTITPTFTEIIAYYLLCLLACRKGGFTGRAGFFLPLAFVILCLHFTQGLYLPKIVHRQAKTARVSFLDVGKGSATFLQFTDGTTTLIDGGGSASSRFNVGRQIIAPFIWKKRIWQVDTLIITHPDSDHYNGLAFISKRFHPRLVYINGQQVPSSTYQELLNTLTQQHIQLITPQYGATLHTDALCRLSCLGMVGLASNDDSDNNQGLVTKLTCGATSFLFPADIERRAEKLLLKQKLSLKSDILLAPHHGSKTSSSHAFIRAVSPKLIIVSAGRRQQNFFPSPIHRRWWQKNHIPLLITGINGTVSCISDGKKVSVTKWKQDFPWVTREIRKQKGTLSTSPFL